MDGDDYRNKSVQENVINMPGTAENSTSLDYGGQAVRASGPIKLEENDEKNDGMRASDSTIKGLEVSQKILVESSDQDAAQ